MKNILTILVLFLQLIHNSQLEKTFISTKWNYSIQNPKEYTKQTYKTAENPMTELHLGDGNGRYHLEYGR